MAEQPLPETVDEAVEYLLSKLDDENRTLLKHIKREELIKLHRPYGMGVRNSLGLWGQNTKLCADPEIAGMFPDDASQYIIERIWERLNSQDNR
jgi:hypothetical protein